MLSWQSICRGLAPGLVGAASAWHTVTSRPHGPVLALTAPPSHPQPLACREPLSSGQAAGGCALDTQFS